MSHKNLLLPLSFLPRVGPTIAKFLQNLIGGNRIFDLLLHLPIRAEKVLILPRLFETPDDSLIIIRAKVEAHQKPKTSKQPYKVTCYTPTGFISLIFFKIFPSQISKMPIGSEIAVLGTLKKINGENQIIHPQEIVPATQIETLSKINVIYPLSSTVSQKFLTKKIQESLSKLNEEDVDWIDSNLLQQKNWPNLAKALKNLHNPQDEDDFSLHNLNRKRLAYDELLAWQIAVLMAKNKGQTHKKFQASSNKNSIEEFLKSLPFDLTQSQLKAISEISAEINSDKKMLRLLQGDVGSGKTVVAIISSLHTILQNKQVCVIAPTTVLAKQHLHYFQRLLQKEEIVTEILTSDTTKKQREKILNNLANGKINILISTHAVLEDDVKFQNLGLAIIDEQHRFGVMQRLKLVEKGQDVDTLLMSATPIPRSLMMGLYGDMDISILAEKPKNRQPIETLVMSAKKIGQLYQAIERAIKNGEKIYWICPAIAKSEDSEMSDEIALANVTQKHEELVKIFGTEKVRLLHGKMKEKDKEKIMAEFADPLGTSKILVATTVIEVGIDVPDATVILIENSENFGLSQLHQLRGRVGRSEKKSFCILLYGEKFGVKQRTRLDILRNSNDGFFIAEEDLKLRGSGELLGTKQSGFPEFKIADLSFDSDLLKIAHRNAQLILNQDRDLRTAPSHKYKILLQLFNYDDCLKIITSG